MMVMLEVQHLPVNYRIIGALEEMSMACCWGNGGLALVQSVINPVQVQKWSFPLEKTTDECH